MAAAVEEAPRNDPPASPTIGACYLVSSSPTGAWAGKSQSIAGYTSGGWRLVTPVEGMSAFIKSSGMFANYRAGVWELGILRGDSVVIGGLKVLGNRAPAISGPSGGTTVDSEARAAVDQILAALRQHGLIES